MVAADRHGEAVILTCSDSDATIRALLAAYPEARDIEINAAGLEQAFLQLTGEPSPDPPDDARPAPTPLPSARVAAPDASRTTVPEESR